jgi:aspartyl-tRNA(Asn)/glutamyl-tRNA(Gln) amidotransferase subunit A
MDQISLDELQTGLAAGTYTSEQLVGESLAKIAREDGRIGAFLSINEDQAMQQARAVDRARAKGEALGLLAGIPVAIKDNILVEGLKNTCGSRMLESFIAPYDAHVVEQLKQAGAVLIGKTNMDEFAMGSSTEHSALRRTVNPVDTSRVPGGSSGGSTAAVAAGMVPLALGSSTGGSIRQPAAFCGVVGMKPTYGRVSRYGLVAFGSSLDQIGPIAADVRGAATLLQALAGKDERDSTSAPQAVPDFLAELGQPLAGKRIGWIEDFDQEGLQGEIRQAWKKAMSFLESQGAQRVPLSLPMTRHAIPTYYLIATAEASSNLARFDGVRYTHRAAGPRNLQDLYTRTRSEGFGMEVKRRILLGTYCLSSGYYQGYYLNAQKVRTLMIKEYREAFERCDLILAPTTPTTAFRLGEKTEDPVAMYLNDIYTVPANLAGLPALSFPAGKDGAGLPIGLQLMAPFFQETRLFAVADALYQHFSEGES